jgi:hypothetical protein
MVKLNYSLTISPIAANRNFKMLHAGVQVSHPLQERQSDSITLLKIYIYSQPRHLHVGLNGRSNRNKPYSAWCDLASFFTTSSSPYVMRYLRQLARRLVGKKIVTAPLFDYLLCSLFYLQYSRHKFFNLFLHACHVVRMDVRTDNM